jgi:CHAD domain-containing protein
VEDLYDRAAVVDMDCDALHRARLAMKKVHYMADVLQSTLGDQAATWIENLHQYQQRMGKIHDVDLLLARLEKYRAKKRGNRRSLEPVRALLLRKRRRLFAAYQAQPVPETPRELRDWLGIDPPLRTSKITSYAVGSATNAEHGSRRAVS